VNDPDRFLQTSDVPACAMTLMAHAGFVLHVGGKLGERDEVPVPITCGRERKLNARLKFTSGGGTQSGMRCRSGAVAAKSDPGRVQPSESRLRTRTRIALTDGIRQRWFVSRSKEDLKALAVSQNNELRPLKIPHNLLILCVTIGTVFTVIEW
jgi:hypothetical protein